MSASRVRGRYAPSPTGALHLGNLRTALLAWLFARAAGGSFTLRIEDLDYPRIRPGAVASMIADLRWLGLDWDEGPVAGGRYGPYFQSQRIALYDAALARLVRARLVYPCYCTRAELALVASAPHAGDEGRPYPGTCRALSSVARQRRDREGRRSSWRFIVPDADILFRDELAGEISERVARTVGDFVVRRSDGVFAYQLAVVVDDALMGVTQVVRGVDLLESTARQLALYDALGFPRPDLYAHAPLLSDVSGARLSKRDAATGLAPLRQRGSGPQEVLGQLACSCGLVPTPAPIAAAELIAIFSPALVRETDATAMIYSP